MTDWKELLQTVRSADLQAMDKAARRQAELAKPPGSLGKLETISIRLAGITGKVQNRIRHCRVLVFAADNGVIAEGVASTPEVVTLTQSINMTRHKTGMSALAAYFGDSVVVTDVGIHCEGTPEGVVARKVRPGTRNLAKEPALTRQEVLQAMEAGLEAVRNAASDGMDAVGIGEMGIGNTTTSAAVLAALLGLPAGKVTGRGAGLTDAAFERKKQVIQSALDLQSPDPGDVVDVLAKVGGLDLCAMVGAYVGAAEQRIPAVVDGFISIVGALAAVRFCPQVRDFLFLSHASYELGYRLAAEALELEPCLLLEMRLGEGSGCPIAFRILEAACAVMCDMATFAEGAIDDGYLEALRGGDAFTVKV